MRRLVVASLTAGLTVGFTAAASAADLGPAPAPVYTKAPLIAPPLNWTGFYAGGNVGWGWLNDDGDPFCINPGGVLNGPGCRTTNVPGAQISGNGVIGGGQLGYNWQTGMWVLGIETDFQGSDIKGSVNIPGPFATVGGGAPGGTAFIADEKLDWFGTVRARVGATLAPSWLVYGTGGLAYGHVEADQNTIFPATQYASSVDVTKAGWTAGGGVEWMIPASNWSAKLEGLYYDLGSVSTSAFGSPINDEYQGGKDFDVKGAIVRVGVNYHFH
jgi:outer membrane immunogenic protein